MKTLIVAKYFNGHEVSMWGLEEVQIYELS